MTKKPFAYIITLNDGLFTVQDSEGTLYAARSTINGCLDRFVAQILYPSKEQRPFDWSAWPQEYKRPLKAAMFREQNRLNADLKSINDWIKAEQ